MGSYFTLGATKADVIAELAATPTVLECEVNRKGDTLWILHQSAQNPNVRLIECCLLIDQKGYGWGYKPMDETMGPYYYDCPVSYIDKASAPLNESSKRWREEVLARVKGKVR